MISEIKYNIKILDVDQANKYKLFISQLPPSFERLM